MVFLILILILECGVMALLKLLGIAYDIEGLSLLFIAADCILFTLIGLTEIKKRNFFICYCAAFSIRLLLLFTDYYFIKIMHSGADTEAFFQFASNGFNTQLGHYFSALSAFFEIVGTTRLFAQFMNLCCGMISCLLVLKALNNLCLNEKAKLMGFALVCFLPNWVNMSAILLRESVIGVFVAVAIYCFSLWFEKCHLSYLIFAIVATLPAVFLHSGMAAVTSALVVSLIIYNPEIGKFKITIRTFISLCGFGFLAIFFLNTYGTRFLPYLGNFELSRLLRAQHYAVEMVDQISSIYLVNLNASTWFELLLFTPVRSLYLYISPMPWDWRGISDVIAFILSGAPTLFVFAYSAVAAFTSKHNRHLALILMLFVICFGIIYSWGTIAAGTAMRHRDKIVPIYAVMLAASYDARLKRHLDYRLPKRIIESFILV